MPYDKSKEAVLLLYVFVSMFYIDMFVRLTYTRRSIGKTDRKETIYSVMLGMMERFITNEKVIEVQANRLLFEMLLYFGTRFGESDEEMQQVKQVYYKFPFNEKEYKEFSEFENLSKKGFPENIDELTDEEINKITSKYTAKPYYEQLLGNHLLSKAEQNLVQETLNHFEKPRTAFRQDQQKFFKNLIQKYYKDIDY